MSWPNAAAREMRISRATAVRWGEAHHAIGPSAAPNTWHQEGHAEALAIGGNQRSKVLEADAPESLGGLAGTPGLFPREILSRLVGADAETLMLRVAR